MCVGWGPLLNRYHASRDIFLKAESNSMHKAVLLFHVLESSGPIRAAAEQIELWSDLGCVRACVCLCVSAPVFPCCVREELISFMVQD